MMYRQGVSRIDGIGVFAARPIRKGETMEELPVDFRGFNSSCIPNVSPGDSSHLRYAMRNIAKDEEMTVHYQINGCRCGHCDHPKLEEYQNPSPCSCPDHNQPPMIRQDVPSKIHGVGVMANRFIRKGEFIFIPSIGLDRGFNSSCTPNILTSGY